MKRAHSLKMSDRYVSTKSGVPVNWHLTFSLYQNMGPLLYISSTGHVFNNDISGRFCFMKHAQKPECFDRGVKIDVPEVVNEMHTPLGVISEKETDEMYTEYKHSWQFSFMEILL